MQTEKIKFDLRTYAEPHRAQKHQSFFKTGKGQYGEGDQFLGVRVPYIRKTVKKYRGLNWKDNEHLLHSPWHEERLFAILMMVDNYQKGDKATKSNLYKKYLANTAFINNWDLVDSSAPHIVGAWLNDKNRKILYDLAQSKSLWERRISILSTLHFIRKHDFSDTLKLCELLLNDNHDLIHKATGWMLREVGKRDFAKTEAFIQKHLQQMPRTMLRYAIEKFPEPLRQKYLKA